MPSASVAEVKQHSRRVVEVEPPADPSRDGLNAIDLATDDALHVDLVDEVDEQRTGAGGPPPLGLVVAVGLAHGDHRVRCDQAPEVVGDDLARGLDEVAEAAVMADEEMDVVGGRDGAQLLARRDGVGDRLLDEHVHAVAGEARTHLEVQLVRDGDDDALDAPVDELAVVGVHRHPQGPTDGRCILETRDRDESDLG